MQPEQSTFEQGPIRPPNEARSLLLRVARNCPWKESGSYARKLKVTKVS